MKEGQERKYRREGLVGPAILIGLGIVFLLNNLGYLEWSVWEIIFRLWPVLLIAAGLDILIGHRSIWGDLLSLILTVALVVGALWVLETGVLTGAVVAEEVSQSPAEATQAEVTIAPAVGRLHIEALRDSNQLVKGVISPVSGEQVRRDFRVEGQTAILTLQSEGNFAGPFLGGWDDERGWDLGLSPNVPLELEFSLGAGEANLDLTGLMVSKIKATMGVGQTTVTLPAEGNFQASIEQAIGNLVVVIPAGMEARIRFDTGLVARQTPDGYRGKSDDVYVSPGYDAAENRVDLKINLAIGNVTVRHSGGQ